MDGFLRFSLKKLIKSYTFYLIHCYIAWQTFVILLYFFHLSNCLII
uniref:Uncharacterized protein n=1 Tax=Ciona intestinalis TaxID=7719 RepID=H2Y173_CIOIN